MHVIVMGAGVIGVTSAWYLNKLGYDVTVIDRQLSSGLETSFANGGQVSVSHPEPWASPRTPMRIIQWLGKEDAPLLFRLRADWSQWKWGMQFLCECLPRRALRNTHAIATLAQHSLRQLQALRETTGIQYNCQNKGILHLFFQKDGINQAQKKAKLLTDYGIPIEIFSPSDCFAIEPTLTHCQEKIEGALYAPNDETGDAYIFTKALSELCADKGVKFQFDTTIQKIKTNGKNRITAIEVLKGGEKNTVSLTADIYVLALGSYSPLIMRPLGRALPIYPIKGYSATVAIEETLALPEISITDEFYRIVCSRLGSVLRIAGTAELDGYNTTINDTRCKAMVERTHTLFPHLRITTSPISYWTGLRPATPGNVPIIGQSDYTNLYYNTGHGSLGWTLACGSGQSIAEIISGRTQKMDFPFYTP